MFINPSLATTGSLKNGVDDIVCISVKYLCDDEWAKEQNASNITVIPDGNLLKAWECWWTKQTWFW